MACNFMLRRVKWDILDFKDQKEIKEGRETQEAKDILVYQGTLEKQ